MSASLCCLLTGPSKTGATHDLLFYLCDDVLTAQAPIYRRGSLTMLECW